MAENDILHLPDDVLWDLPSGLNEDLDMEIHMHLNKPYQSTECSSPINHDQLATYLNSFDDDMESNELITDITHDSTIQIPSIVLNKSISTDMNQLVEDVLELTDVDILSSDASDYAFSSSNEDDDEEAVYPTKSKIINEDEDDLELLQSEMQFLNAKAAYLQSQLQLKRKKCNVRGEKRQRTSIKKLKYQKECMKQQSTEAIATNHVLATYVSSQQAYIKQLHLLLGEAPIHDVRLTLTSPLDTYIELPVDVLGRQMKILSLREGLLDTAYNYIIQKTEALSLNDNEKMTLATRMATRGSIIEVKDHFEQFGKTYDVNMSISRYDNVDVETIRDQMSSDCVVRENVQHATLCKHFSPNCPKPCVPLHELEKEVFLHFHMVNKVPTDTIEAAKVKLGKDEIEMESNMIMFRGMVNDSVVLASTYVDKDPLLPYKTHDLNRMRRDTSQGIVLTQGYEDDGSKYVIVKRYFMAKTHGAYNLKVSDMLQDRIENILTGCK